MVCFLLILFGFFLIKFLFYVFKNLLSILYDLFLIDRFSILAFMAAVVKHSMGGTLSASFYLEQMKEIVLDLPPIILPSVNSH